MQGRLIQLLLEDHTQLGMRILSYIAILGLGFFSSCDPMYSISICNQTSDTVSFAVVATSRFKIWSDEPLEYQEEYGPNLEHTAQFKLAPGDTVNCGQVIGGLEDDVPFTKFSAKWRTGNLVANSELEVLALFDKNFWGNRKTPYQLTIR